MNLKNTFTASFLLSLSLSIIPQQINAATATEIANAKKDAAVALFNEACYLKRYPDVAAAWPKKVPLLLHFNRHGYDENRKPGCDAAAPVVVKPGAVQVKLEAPPPVNTDGFPAQTTEGKATT